MKTKTQVLEKEQTKEMTDAQREAICYKSTLLNKYFDKYEDLVKEEEEYKRVNAEKLKLQEEKKAEVNAIKEAIKTRVLAERECIESKREAYKAYLDACDKAEKKVADAKKTEQELLTKFCEKNPGGFHDTVTIGDVTYNYSYNTNHIEPFKRLLDWRFF